MKICLHLTSEKYHKKENSKLKLKESSKLGKFVFDLVKEHVPLWHRLKKSVNKLFWCPFLSNSQHFLRPFMCHVKKQHFKVKFWNWGFKIIWSNLHSGQFFSLQNQWSQTCMPGASWRGWRGGLPASLLTRLWASISSQRNTLTSCLL